MIEIKNIQKVFDNQYEALKNINLDISEGELVCLLGPSGCGKSTLLNIIAGLLDPSQGDVLFKGESVINKHPKDRDIGMVFQSYALYPHMTVLENVSFPLRVGDNKIKKDQAEERVQDYMKLTDIEDLADKKPAALSGGQQQRVAIARSLVKNPKVLLLDEPLSNLDARLRLRIREEIRRMVKNIGVTTIFVTHDQEEALSIGDKIALMDQGVIQQYDVPQNLYLDPANLFVAKFIGNPLINTYDLVKENDYLRGPSMSLALDNLDKDRFKDNLDKDKYIVGIRPEHFIVDENGSLETIIDSVEMIGRYSILHFDLGQIRSRAVVDSRTSYEERQKIRLRLDYGSIYLFQEDGRRVY